MDYQRSESLGLGQERPNSELPESLNSHANFGELGKQAIISNNEESSENQATEADAVSAEGNTASQGIKIIDQTPQKNENQELPLIFQPSEIHRNGDKISPETLRVVEEIENSMASNPAVAVANFQAVRRHYNGEGKTA